MSFNVRMKTNGPGIERLRTISEALILSDRDKKGPLLIELDAENIKQVRRAFATKGASTPSGPWRAWSKSYAAWRSSEGLGKLMLRLTDSMFDKFVSRTHGSHIARWRKPLKYDFGVLDDVAFIHQNALEGKPKRSVIDKTSKDHRKLVDRFVKFYGKRLRQTFRNVTVSVR